MADLSSLMKPLTNASSGISNIFVNNNDYSSLSQLLHLHMKMLDNISNKIDVVMKGIEFIIENQLEYIRVLKNIPEDTVAELYKSDLEGLFLLINEKIEAYAIEKENGTFAVKKKELIFDEILIELQMARAKLLTINNYLNLPLVSICLYFELFCMYIAEQPNSYIKTTLNSYKKWINRQMENSVKKYYDEAQFEQKKNLKNILNDYTYTHCMKSEVRYAGESGIEGSTDYTVSLHKYNYYLEPTISNIDFEQIKHLIDNKYINSDELPSRLFFKTVPDDSGEYNFTISDGPVPFPSEHSIIKKIKIKENFYINNSNNGLKSSAFDCTDPKFNNVIFEKNADVIKFSALINDNYFRLIIYASLLNCAHETNALIDKWLSNSSNYSEFTIYDLTIKNEYLTRINNERLNTWINFLNEKENELHTIEKREILIAIKSEMQKISNPAR